jgi:RNA polymerase sigma factor (sigma-70 family)
MPDPEIDELVQRLQDGDPDAAEQLVRAYEPYLRMVIRRQLSTAQRAKFDSIDIVQSIWLDVLDGFNTAQWQFETHAQLKALLVRIAKNRLIDRVRQSNNSVRLASLLSEELPNTEGATPSEELISHELWSQLLELCPIQHHPILELRRQGFKIVEIAEQLKLHSGSVRRILYDLAKRLELRNGRDSSLIADGS